MSATITVKRLRRGDRFSFIPAAWYGAGTVIRSSTSDPHWRLTFDNAKVVSPPGVWYGDPNTRVRLLRRSALTPTMHFIRDDNDRRTACGLLARTVDAAQFRVRRGVTCQRCRRARPVSEKQAKMRHLWNPHRRRRALCGAPGGTLTDEANHLLCGVNNCQRCLTIFRRRCARGMWGPTWGRY